MTTHNNLVPVSELVSELSLNELCRICGSHAEWVITLVEEGILEPQGATPRMWRFDSVSITVVRKVQRLQTDLGLNTAGVALVLSLVEENAHLKQRLRALEHAWPVVIPMEDF